MKSIPTLDYSRLQPKAGEKPNGKFGNLKNYLQEQGVEVCYNKLRSFFEDMITEVLKNPAQWDRTRNINFMELFHYLGGTDEEMPQEQPAEPQGKPITQPEG